MSPRWLTVLASLSILIATPAAWAFCRATTCNPEASHCSPNQAGCLRDGYPLFWESSCITVSVQADGAPKAGIDYDAARATVERAFEAWTSVECPGGGNPSIHVEVQGPVACSEAEYNSKQNNANIVMFHDDSWPYAGKSPDELGFTRLNFDLDSGALYDADIELNAVSAKLSVGRMPSPDEIDLDSVVTHEVGHLLGLNHSTETESTLRAGYDNGSIELRTPSADDVAGICAIYPPNRKPTSDGCEPRHGFSELCAAEQPEPPVDEAPTTTSETSACSLRARPNDAHGNGNFALAVALAALGVRRARTQPLRP